MAESSSSIDEPDLTPKEGIETASSETGAPETPLARMLVPALVLAAIVIAIVAVLLTRSLAPQGGDTTSGEASTGPEVSPNDGSTGSPLDFAGFAIEPARAAYDFEMPSHTGEPFRIADAEGKVVLITFGYTFCPDVCPNTLNKLAYAMQDLGDLAQDVQVVFVSVDPDRDTPEGMAAFLRNYDPSFLGLVGDMDEITDATGKYGVAFYKEYPPDEGEKSEFYTVAHSATVFLIDRDGQLRASLLGPYTPDDAAHDVRLLLSEGE